MMVHEELPLIEFTAHDRCDRCGAQAYTLAKNPDFGELLFCAHHSREYRLNLFQEGWSISDDAEGLESLGYSFPQLTDA